MERAGKSSPNIESMSSMEILEKGLRVKRLEEIPVSSLHLEGALTDQAHIDELRGMIEDEGGLIIPLGVCAFFNENRRVIYEIFDGYHRGSALEALGWPFADAKVLYGRSREELYDLRVVSASSVRSVSFSRLIVWMQNSFEETDWYNKYNLSLAQVLGLAWQDSSGERLGLEPEIAEGAKTWARQKAKRWGRKDAAVLYQTMLAVENSSLDIVKMVRISPGGGKDGKGVLNPARFMAMVAELPRDISAQKFMMKLIINNNLLKEETAEVARALANAKDRKKMIARLKVNPRSVLGKGAKRADIPEVDEQLREVTSRQRIFTSGASVRSQLRPDDVASAREIQSLKTALAVINEKQVLTKDANGDPYWWLTFSGLSQDERMVMSGAFGEGTPLGDIADDIGKTVARVALLIASAHRKYILFLDDVRLKQRMRELKQELDYKNRHRGKNK